MCLSPAGKDSIEALAARVLALGAPPAGPLATAAQLESFGISDRAAAELGHTNVFVLAEQVEARCRRLLADAPELTVSMPAYNRATLIGEAIASVLAQRGVNLELIVVDDGSSDHTSDVVEAIADPRIRLLRNAHQRGIAYCHNRVVRNSLSTFIAHVDSDDRLLPGALKEMVGMMRQSPDVGQGHCGMVFINRHGQCLREAERARFTSDRRANNRQRDYRRDLLLHGTVNNSLRTYRREALRSVGDFNENLKVGIDWEMGLRLAQYWQLRRSSRALYCIRLHPGRTTPQNRLMSYVWWWDRVRGSWPLLRSGEIQFAKTTRYRWRRLMLESLWLVIRAHLPFRTWWLQIRGAKHRIGASLRSHGLSVKQRIYQAMSLSLRRLPLRPRNASDATPASPRVLYFLWRYPVLSQTFIRREILALKNTGIEVCVVSEIAGEALTDSPWENADAYTSLEECTEPEVHVLARRLFLQRPVAFAHAVLFLVGNYYGVYKSLTEDLSILSKAIRLAHLLRQRDANRVHCPWANRSALIAMVAARLSGVTYSVQARAHDLHRLSSRDGLRERLLAADVIITNADYNRRQLGELITGNRHVPPVVRIYEGIDPDLFIPAPKRSEGGLRLLCVARWIEEKGLIPLLRVLARLRGEGLDFKCYIVGGAEQPTYTNYRIALHRLHRQLNLEDCVILTGALSFDRVVEEYRQADLFVLPCVEASNGGRDISPQSIVEAMAMELPVISSHSGGIPELVVDKQTGILCQPGDELELAAAIRTLAEDAEMRHRFGCAGRSRVLEKFDIRRNVQTYAQQFGLKT